MTARRDAVDRTMHGCRASLTIRAAEEGWDRQGAEMALALAVKAAKSAYQCNDPLERPQLVIETRTDNVQNEWYQSRKVRCHSLVARSPAV